MSTTVGTLEIEMAANIARLSADLGVKQPPPPSGSFFPCAF